MLQIAGDDTDVFFTSLYYFIATISTVSYGVMSTIFFFFAMIYYTS